MRFRTITPGKLAAAARPAPLALLPVLFLNTHKSIRKWRDRLFMAGERMRARRRIPAGRRILVSPWPEVEAAVRRSFGGLPHSLDFGPVPPGGGDYDLVVPMSIEALRSAAVDAVLRQKNPLPLPDLAAIELCDDKAALNARLRACGFARHVPEDAAPGRYPYMLKRRRDACARHAFRIGGAADEREHRERIESPDYLRQAWVDGQMEYTTHLLHRGGRVRRALTISFRMRDAGAIRGRDVPLLQRRCHSRHLKLFEAMLNAIGFEGLCCVNYKLRAGVPLLLEINPRCGFSLAPFFATFLRGMKWRR